MTPEEAAAASADAVSNLTARFMLDMTTCQYGASLGFQGMSFYTAGRGGVLGDVNAGMAQALGALSAAELEQFVSLANAAASATA